MATCVVVLVAAPEMAAPPTASAANAASAVRVLVSRLCIVVFPRFVRVIPGSLFTMGQRCKSSAIGI